MIYTIDINNTIVYSMAFMTVAGGWLTTLSLLSKTDLCYNVRLTSHIPTTLTNKEYSMTKG